MKRFCFQLYLFKETMEEKIVYFQLNFISLTTDCVYAKLILLFHHILRFYYLKCSYRLLHQGDEFSRWPILFLRFYSFVAVLFLLQWNANKKCCNSIHFVLWYHNLQDSRLRSKRHAIFINDFLIILRKIDLFNIFCCSAECVIF